MTIRAFTDGASRGNPGEAGVGVILKDEQGKTVSKTFGFVGTATNNAAEYLALIACLKLAAKLNCERLVVHSDSELMVRQMNGEYKVKDAAIRDYFQEVYGMLERMPFEFEIVHVAREENKEADQLANLGIDSKRPLRV